MQRFILLFWMTLGLPQKNFAFFEKGIAAGSGELLNTSFNCAVGRSS